MSIFLRIERFAAAPRLLQCRDLVCVFGEDARGILGWSEVSVAYFSLRAQGAGYLLGLEQEGIVLNGQAAPYGYETLIEHSAKLCFRDSIIFIKVTSPLAEILARSPGQAPSKCRAVPDLPGWPAVSFEFIGVHRLVPLPPASEVVLGSNPDSAILVQLQGIAPHHCAFQSSEGTVVVYTLEGKIRDPALGHRERLVYEKSAKLTLEPLGLDIDIKFP